MSTTQPEAGRQEKRLARDLQGPAHERAGGTMATLKRTVTEFKEDNLTDSAAALTYYGVLSIFPALIALVAVVGLIGNPQKIIMVATKSLGSLVPGLGGAVVERSHHQPGKRQRRRKSP